MVRALFIAFFAVLLPACGGEVFKPATVVENMRVLGIRAEPAELRPGETAALSALVVDPTRPGQPNTLLWISCDPDPFGLGRNACSDTAALQDPAALGASDGGLPPGMRVAGFNDFASYTAPADLFSVLPADDARRLNGSVAQFLLIAVAEQVSPTATRAELDELFRRVREKELRSVLAIFRMRVSEDPQRNTNPPLTGFVRNGTAIPLGEPIEVNVRETVALSVATADGGETYTQLGPDGVEEQKTESFIGGFFATAGRFQPDRVVLGEVDAEYTGPGGSEVQDPIPANGRGTLWVVVRDTRGGQSWLESPLLFCDSSLPAPVVSAVSPSTVTAAGGETVRLEGQNLENVLEVRIGGAALIRGAYSTSLKTYQGTMPALAAGTYDVMVKGRGCGVVSSGKSVVVQ